MVDQWLSRLSFKQHIALFVTGVFAAGLLTSILVLLANYSPSQAALAFLFAVSTIFLICIVRVAFLVVRLLQS